MNAPGFLAAFVGKLLGYLIELTQSKALVTD